MSNSELKDVCGKIIGEYIKCYPIQADLDNLKKLQRVLDLFIGGHDVTVNDITGITYEEDTDDIFVVGENLFVKFFKLYSEYVANHKIEFNEDCSAIYGQICSEDVSFNLIFLNLVLRVYVRLSR